MDAPEMKRKRRTIKKEWIGWSPEDAHTEQNPTIVNSTEEEIEKKVKSFATEPSSTTKRNRLSDSTSIKPLSLSGKPSYPFEVDDTDHCETPLDAYRDVIAVLDQIAKSLGKTRNSVSIYDPYYCDGGVEAKLNLLGCQNVLNENQDFYMNITNKSIPDYDVLVTNPPYSGDHIEKLLTFTASSKKPYLLLMPHFVYTKDYYTRSKGQDDIFFLVPKSRYSYLPPQWVKSNSGSTTLSKGKTNTAPFPSFWYCCAGENLSHAWLEMKFGKSGHYDHNRKVHYASSKTHIPRDSKGEFDKSKKRPNPKARKRAMAAKQQAQKL